MADIFTGIAKGNQDLIAAAVANQKANQARQDMMMRTLLPLRFQAIENEKNRVAALERVTKSSESKLEIEQLRNEAKLSIEALKSQFDNYKLEQSLKEKNETGEPIYHEDGSVTTGYWVKDEEGNSTLKDTGIKRPPNSYMMMYGGGGESYKPPEIDYSKDLPGQLHPEALEGLPQNERNLAMLYHDGVILAPDARSRTFLNISQQNALAAVHAYDPSWTAGLTQAQYSLLKSFASGKDSLNMKSLRRFYGHNMMAWKHYNELHSSDLKAANRIKNWFVGEVGGSEALKSLQGDFKAMAGELAALLKSAGGGAAGTIPEIEDWKKYLSPDDPKHNIAVAIREAANIANQQLRALHTQYRDYSRGHPMPKPILEEDARDYMRRVLKFDPSYYDPNLTDISDDDFINSEETP